MSRKTRQDKSTCEREREDKRWGKGRGGEGEGRGGMREGRGNGRGSKTKDRGEERGGKRMIDQMRFNGLLYS